MLTLLTLVSVISIAIQISNTENTNCENVCQTNSLCVKKCEEYAKNPNRHPLSDPNCGLSKLDGKVPEFVDETEPPGQTSNKMSFPWMVSLQYEYESNNNRDMRPHFCSGVIISEYFVLSSAHCVPAVPGGYQLMIGSSSLRADDPTAQILEVESIEVPGLVYFPWVKKHEKYGKTVEGNDDILLIKTVDKIIPKIIENEFVVNSICLSEPNYKPTGIARIAGWGFQDINKDIIQDLMVVDNPIISNEEADKVIKGTRHYYGKEGQYYVYNISLSEKELYSMASHNPGLMGRSDPLEFNGDSGSPIFQINNDRAFSIGVSHLVAKDETPISIWTRLSSYTDWLEVNTKKTIWQLYDEQGAISDSVPDTSLSNSSSHSPNDPNNDYSDYSSVSSLPSNDNQSGGQLSSTSSIDTNPVVNRVIESSSDKSNNDPSQSSEKSPTESAKDYPDYYGESSSQSVINQPSPTSNDPSILPPNIADLYPAYSSEKSGSQPTNDYDYPTEKSSESPGNQQNPTSNVPPHGTTNSNNYPSDTSTVKSNDYPDYYGESSSQSVINQPTHTSNDPSILPPNIGDLYPAYTSDQSVSQTTNDYDYSTEKSSEPSGNQPNPSSTEPLSESSKSAGNTSGISSVKSNDYPDYGESSSGPSTGVSTNNDILTQSSEKSPTESSKDYPGGESSSGLNKSKDNPSEPSVGKSSESNNSSEDFSDVSSSGSDIQDF